MILQRNSESSKNIDADFPRRNIDFLCASATFVVLNKYIACRNPHINSLACFSFNFSLSAYALDTYELNLVCSLFCRFCYPRRFATFLCSVVLRACVVVYVRPCVFEGVHSFTSVCVRSRDCLHGVFCVSELILTFMFKHKGARFLFARS